MTRHASIRRRHATRLLALALAIMVVPVAFGAPQDLTQLAAPDLGSDPPAAQSIEAFDVSVASMTGAANLSIPISLAPGRAGMVPSLSLTYSSQAPIYGSSNGSGWALNLPEIRYDTSRARFRQVHYAGTTEPEWEDEPFISTLSGGRPLVPVTGDVPAANAFAYYRARNDSAWTQYARYHRVGDPDGAAWSARTPDGVTHYFGEPGFITNLTTVDTADLVRVRAPLTHSADSFGNVVEYRYKFEADELLPSSIRYTLNPASGVDYFAEVTFVYGAPAFCTVKGEQIGPISAQTDFRTGLKLVDGASPLIQIVATALDPSTHAVEHTRQIDLTYSAATESCTGNHAPFRQLVSVQQRAWHTGKPQVVLPPTTFQYGSADVALTSDPTPPPLWLTTSEAVPNNLAWGERFNGPTWPTVEAMLVDLDGDSLVDRLVNTSAPPEQNPAECEVTWWRNMGNGNFEEQSTLQLPRLPWQGPRRCALNYQRTELSNNSIFEDDNGGTCLPDHYGSYVAYRWIDVTGDGLTDLVTAVHHDAWFDPSDPTIATPTGEPWPACTGDRSACPALDHGCIDDARDCPAQGGPCRMKPNLAEACVANADRVPCEDMTLFMGGGGGDFGVGDNSGHPNCSSFNFTRGFKLACGLYPWTIYKNLGNGEIDLQNPETILQPIALESDTGDTSMSAGGFWGRQQAVFDFDGDTAADVLIRGRFDVDNLPPGVPPFWWFGYLGDGVGGFLKNATTGLHEPYFFQMPQLDDDSLTHTQRSGFPLVGSTAVYGLAAVRQVVDFNGDGAPDYLRHVEPIEQGDGGVNVHFNDGLGMRAFGEIGAAEETLVHPLAGMSKAVVTTTDWSGDPDKPNINDATRSARIQLADVDNDGRPDMYRTTPGANDEMFYNLGTDLSSPDTTLDPLMELGLVQSMAVSETVVANKNIWQTTSGLVDVDGDGIGEAIWFDGDLHLAGYDPAGQPPRLLTEVANGRGAVTKLRYAPLSDPDVVDNDPTAIGSTASPRTQWVVKSVERSDAFEASTGTTEYRFDDPVFNQDDEGRHAFRGFKEVAIIGPRGNATIERYRFDDSSVAAIASPDWSGRLVETVTMLDDPDQDPASVHSIARQSWQSGVLFGGKLVTYHPLDARTYTCQPAQTEAACVQSPAGFTKQHTALTSIAGLLTVESETTLQDSESYDEGDRRSTQTFDLFTTGNVYRLRQRRTDSFQQLSTNEVLYASTQTDWDATYRVPIRSKVQLDAAGLLAVTEQTFDMVTGNLLTVRKPKQVDASGPLSTRTYDSRKLLIAEVINELGHDNESVYEYGTGALIEERGPNFRTCDPNCPPDPPEGPLPVRDGKRISVDGFGRPLQIEAVIPYYPGSPGGQTYKWSVVETLAYVDAPVGSFPAKVTDEKRIDHADSRFTSVTTELDGHGRPIRTIEKVYGTAPADAVTTFDYDVDGKLIAVAVPDPSQNTSAQVTFTYSFDSIGRPTGMRRPDAIAPTPRSGIDVTYEGLTETRLEVAGIGGSSPTGGPAKTKLVADPFGRLVEVHEQRLASPETFTVTSYAYSPRDEVSTIVASIGEEDEVTTQLEHDLAGRRTRITRGARIWKYSYDKNSNLSTETVPSPDPPDDELDYRTSFVYDALDRLTSKSIPQRDLSDDDYELFGAAVVNYTWDQGLYNRMGRIVYFNTRGPNGTNVFNGRYYYDAEGNINTEDRTFNVTTIVNQQPVLITLPERAEGYRHAAFGRIKTVINADGSGLTGSPPSENNSTVNTVYDDRGNPLKLQLQRPGLSNHYVGVQTRNVAGLVTKRRTDQTGQAMTFIESNWVYDKLGRVTSQTIVKNPGTLPANRVAQQDLTYWGNDDPKTLDHWIGASNHKRFEYSFDRRHQLTGVTETAAGGAFAATYAFGPAGRFDRATVTPTALPGSDVRPRDVEYSYMANDPEAVSSLDTPIGGGQSTPYASYEYDSVGNQISRTYWTDTALPTPQPLPSGSELTWQFLYDGEEQLRRVTDPDGNIEEYWYDHNGQRALIRTRPLGGPITWRWFHNNTEVEWKTDDLADASPVVEHTLAYASLGTPVARIQDRNDRTEFQFHGLASSTLATVESGIGVLEQGDPASPASGTTDAAFFYTPFGEIIETVGSESGNHRRRQNDKYQDAASSLHYYGVRYFDAVSMVWTQADPLYRFAPDAAWIAPRRAGLYTFVVQNPLRYIDPDGRDAKSAAQTLVQTGLSNPYLAPACFLTAGALAGVAVLDAAIPDAPDYYAKAFAGELTRQEAIEAGLINGSSGGPIVPPVDEQPTPAPAPAPENTPTTTDIVPYNPFDEEETTEKVKPLPTPTDKDGNPLPKPKRLPTDPVIDDVRVYRRPWYQRIWPFRRKSGASDGSQTSGRYAKPAPADRNHDGRVDDEEEAEHMREVNNGVRQ